MRKLFYYSNLVTLCLVLSSVGAKAQAPSVTTDPHDTTICSGVITTFHVAATDTPSYHWQESTNGTTWNNLTDGGLYSGVSTNALSISGTTSISGNWYRAIATNSNGSDTSAPATLTVNPLPNAGFISGPIRICHNTLRSLSTSGTGGTWSSANTSVATVSSTGNIYGLTPGIDTFYYISTNSCGSDTAWYQVTIDGPLAHTAITGPVTVCSSSSINLSNASAGGTWSATNGNATVSAAGMVSGVSAGVDTIIYRYGNACSTDSAFATITIESPLPAVTISGPSTACAGSLAPFIASNPGGFWLSNDGSVATVDLMTGVVTGRGQGVATISYIMSNACGGVIATDTIQVDRAASMITGPDSVGVLAHITLMDSTIGGTWSSVDPSIASVNSATGVVTGYDTFSTVIMYTVSNSCGITSSSKTIYVGIPSSAGTISGPDSVCAGSSITLTPAVTGGVWTASNPAVSVNSMGVVTGLIGGMSDTLTYTVTNGFGSNSVTKVIYVNQTPVITITGPSSVDLDYPYTLTATPAGGTWVSTNTSVAQFISANTFVAYGGGISYMIYTVSNTCGSSKDTFIVNIPVDNSSVSNVNGTKTSMNIFPNPSNGSFTLNIATAGKETAHVTITNVAGAAVKEMDVDTNSNTAVTIQTAGIYFVTADTKSGKTTSRIVVTR